jgi:chaperonin GroEL
MAKQLLYTDEARKKLLAGADKLAKAVGSTLGPTGRNVIIEKKLRRPDRYQGRRHRLEGN